MTPIERARISLDGLSVGDAFGERFFVADSTVERFIENRTVPQGQWRYMEADAGHDVWPYTDDTEMALSVVDILEGSGKIDQDKLARAFATRYDYARRYGAAMHGLLGRIRSGADWREAAPALFGGQGSFGNGGAMRVAPVGAYFADDLDEAAEQAILSAEVTHSHLEGVAGAIAVSVASALAWRAREMPPDSPEAFLAQVAERVPDSAVRTGIERAIRLLASASPTHAAVVLGSGYEITAQDTVPFSLWCAAHFLNDYEEALWATVSGLGGNSSG